MAKIHSYKLDTGKTWTACSECERGGNGSDKDKCSCGWRIKRFNSLGCYIGTPLESIKDKLPESRLRGVIRELLKSSKLLIKSIESWESSVEQIIGRVPRTYIELDQMRAAIEAAEREVVL